jgi:hypothetical protein
MSENTDTKKKEVIEKAQAYAGTPKQMGDDKIKDTLLSFNAFGVSAGVQLVTAPSKKTGVPETKPTFYNIVYGKFCELPRDPKFLIEYGQFLIDVGTATKGVELFEARYDEGDIIAAQKKLAPFKAGA